MEQVLVVKDDVEDLVVTKLGPLLDLEGKVIVELSNYFKNTE